MLPERQHVSLVSATELGCSLGVAGSDTRNLSRLLQRAASTLNSVTQEVCLPWQALLRPRLLAQASPAHNVQLLALAPPHWHPQHQPPESQPPGLSRGQVYAATVLQHAAFLLLLLVSDSLLLLIPSPAVPDHVLQLLHALPKVRQQLLQLIYALQKQARLAKAGKGQQQQQEPQQQQLEQPDGSSTGTASTPAEGQQEQQYELLLQLLQKPATRLHIAVQVSSYAEAPLCVQQAEQTLLKCKAAVTARQDTTSADSNKAPTGSRANRSSSVLFELAGVHACTDDTSSQTAARKAVLRAIQQQLFSTSALQQQLQDKEQQQQLPTADRVLASLVAAAAAAGQSSPGPDRTGSSTSMANLQQLWQHLLQLLFPALSNGSSSSDMCYPFYQRISLHADDAVSDDVSADSADDADWDEVDDSWQEVTHHAESAGDDSDETATAPGELLTSAVDPLYNVSSKRCAAAARAALRAYLQAVPPRYTAPVHEAAVKTALLQYQTAAAGPAADDVLQQLQEACVAVWQSGRQQCSAVSLTGRPCTMPPHEVSKVPHSSGCSFPLAAPNGCEQQQQEDDWFSFDDANSKSARHLIQLQQQQQTMELTAMIAAEAKLLLGGADQERPNIKQQHHIQLGSWFSLWQRSLEPAAAGSTAASAAVVLPGQRWLSGFNKLLPLRVLGASRAAATAAAEVSDSDEQTSEDAQQDAAAAAAADPVTSINILEGILQGINIKGSPGNAGRRGGRRGARGAAAASDSWSEVMGKPGNRGAKSKVQQPPLAPAAVALGPEDFPTLSEAATGVKKALAGADKLQQQQQQPPADSSAAARGSGRQRHKRKDAGGKAEQLQQQLVQAWSHLDQQQSAAAGAEVPSTYMNAVSSSRAPKSAGAGVSVQAEGSSARRGRGRGHKAAAAVAAAVERPLPTTVTPADEPSVLATLLIGLEYESLCGVRAVLHPSQLLTAVQQQEQQRQQEQATAAAAAVAAAAAARNLPGGRGQGRGRGRGDRTQLQQQLQRETSSSSTVPHSRQSAAGSSGVDVSGVQQLVLQDVPLFIHPAAAGISADGKASASPAATATAAGPSVAALDIQLLQLRRIYVRTPPAPFMFSSHPRVRFTAAAAVGGMGGTEGSAAQEAAADGGSSSSSIEFSISGPVQLPADSLLVLSIPQVYGAPAGWVQAVCPAAVEVLQAAAVDMVGINTATVIAASKNGVDTAESSKVRSTAASSDDESDSELPADVADTASTARAAGSAEARGSSKSSIHLSEHQWLPLIPVQAAPAEADSSGAAASPPTAAATAAGSGKGGGDPPVPGVWSAYLCGGSWLYPVAVQQA